MSLGAPGGVVATSRRSLAGLVAKGKGANGITRGAARGGGNRGAGAAGPITSRQMLPLREGVLHIHGVNIFSPPTSSLPTGTPSGGALSCCAELSPRRDGDWGGGHGTEQLPPRPRSRFGVVCNHKAGEIWLRVKFARCRVSGHFILIKCSGAKSLP